MSLDGGKYARRRAPTGATEIEQIEIAAKYSGYIDRQHDEVERAAHFENLKLPADFDYGQVTALSFEVRQKLAKHRPETLGLASRISGVTPAAISLLMIHLRKGGHRAFATRRVDRRIPGRRMSAGRNAARRAPPRWAWR